MKILFATLSLCCSIFIFISCATIDREIIFNYDVSNTSWNLTDSLDEFGRNKVEFVDNNLRLNFISPFLQEYFPEWGGPLIFPIIPLSNDYNEDSQLSGFNISFSSLNDSCSIDLTKIKILFDTVIIIPEEDYIDWSEQTGLRVKKLNLFTVDHAIKNIRISFVGKVLSPEKIVIELGEIKKNDKYILIPPIVYVREMKWRYLPLFSFGN